MIKATVMISTKDRPGDLNNVLKRLRKLDNYKDIEIIVTDDGSRQNIERLFEKSYPEVIFRRSDVSFNYVRHRNNMFRMAKGDYVFSIDDDAWYEQSDSIEKAIEIFKRNPKAGILNFRVNLPDRGTISENKSAGRPFAVAEFIGCAHAIRKSCFNEGEDLYDELYLRQGEERDLAIKCLDKGYDILQVNNIVVFHNYQGKNRDHQSIHTYAFRNELFFYLKYFPGLRCPAFLVKCFLSHTRFCFGKMWFRAFFAGIYGFFRFFLLELRKRKPIKQKTVRRYLRLLKESQGAGR
ncbi:MAG: glycosyltransferase [Candidatus Omnitrophota bacterium]